MPKILEQKKLNKYPIKLFKYVRSPYWWFSFFVHKTYSANGMEYKSSKIKDLRKAEAFSISYFRKFNFEKYENYKEKPKLDFHKDIAIPYFNIRKLTNEKRYKKELGQYNNEILPLFKDIDYPNTSEVEEKVSQLFYNLKIKGLAVATCRNYKIIVSNMFNKALKNNNIPFDVMPEFPKLAGNSIRRLAYSPKETKQIINTFRDEYKHTENEFYDEVADFLCMLKSAGFRPGLELLKVKRNHIGFINDPENPNKPIMKVTLLETKKDRHAQTVADWFRDDVYPRIINRYQNATALDYLFFPDETNREKLFNRIRKNFIRISDKIGLYDVNGQKRPIYTFRHSFISNRRSKEVDPNIVAIHSNTSVAMINKHYQDLSDDNLVNIHNQLYPERTKKSQNKKLKK
jgi:hypothetical protein